MDAAQRLEQLRSIHRPDTTQGGGLSDSFIPSQLEALANGPEIDVPGRPRTLTWSTKQSRFYIGYEGKQRNYPQVNWRAAITSSGMYGPVGWEIIASTVHPDTDISYFLIAEKNPSNQ